MGKFKKPEKQKPPPPVAPAPTVQDAEPAAEDVMRQERSKSGYQSSILAGALTPTTGKKKKFGGA